MKEKHYMLVVRKSCPYCSKALDLLKDRQCSFAYTDMDNARKLLNITLEQSNWKTVPMIWEQTLEWEDDQPTVVENNFVGGFTELVKAFEVGEEND
jgi:glutaredoxin